MITIVGNPADGAGLHYTELQLHPLSILMCSMHDILLMYICICEHHSIMNQLTSCCLLEPNASHLIIEQCLGDCLLVCPCAFPYVHTEELWLLS